MRKATFWSLAVVLACGLAAGCSSGPKGTPEDTIIIMNEATEVLKGVKEEKDVEAAKPKLQKLAEKFKANAEEAKKKNPGATAGKGGITTDKEVIKKMEEAGLNFGKEAERVKKIKGGEELVKEFQEAAMKASSP
jgi:hypothetical protein